MIHAVEKPEDLGTSAHELFEVLYKNSKSSGELVASVNSWVDVRDIAQAHVVALQKPKAGGERILVSVGKALLVFLFHPGLKFLARKSRTLHLARL